MDNSYQPPGDPQDYQRTQDIGPAGTPWWQPGTAGRSGAPRSPRQRRGRGLWWPAGLVVVALLVGGGAFAVTRLAASGAPAGPRRQAAQLNSVLNSASSPGSASAADSFAEAGAGSPASLATPGPCQARAAKLKGAGHSRAAVRALGRCRNVLRRLRLVGGEHGQFTFATKKGTTTLAYERGVVQSVSGQDVVVKAADGTTWTWVLQGNTVIRQAGGKKTSSSALAAGKRVFAGGPVVSGSYQARLIVIQASSASPSPGS